MFNDANRQKHDTRESKAAANVRVLRVRVFSLESLSIDRYGGLLRRYPVFPFSIYGAE